MRLPVLTALTPATGDTPLIYIAAGLLIAAVVTVAVVLLLSRKKKD